MSESKDDLKIIEDADPNALAPLEIEVEKAPDAAERPVRGTEDADPNADALDSLRRQLEEHKRTAEAERRARMEAERLAEEERLRAQQAFERVELSELDTIKGTIDRINEANTYLENQLASAMEAGDFRAAAKIQNAMAINGGRLAHLESGRISMESQPKREPPPPPRPRAPVTTDPVEQIASQLTPRSASWVRAHPEYATDHRLMQKMIAAHNLATADGIPPDTDDYFASIERTLGIEGGETESPAPRPQRRAAPASAPPSRSVPGSSPRPNTVRLSAEEREFARMNGQSDEEYARHKYALIKEGKLH